jgi:hypothetical protein
MRSGAESNPSGAVVGVGRAVCGLGEPNSPHGIAHSFNVPRIGEIPKEDGVVTAKFASFLAYMVDGRTNRL